MPRARTSRPAPPRVPVLAAHPGLMCMAAWRSVAVVAVWTSRQPPAPGPGRQSRRNLPLPPPRPAATATLRSGDTPYARDTHMPGGKRTPVA